MDDDGGLGIRNWGFLEQPLKRNLGLQLMPGAAEREKKALLSEREPPSVIIANRNGGFVDRDCRVSEPMVPMEFVRDGWITQRDLPHIAVGNSKLLHVLPGNSNFVGKEFQTMISEPPPTHSMSILPPDSSKGGMVQVDNLGNKEENPSEKRSGGGLTCKAPKSKRTKRVSVSKDESNCSEPLAKPGKKNVGVVIDGIDLDISGIPIPVCSCTGAPQQCYRWGTGGWQSACCTTSISMYPLPMSPKRRSARIAGRKMSRGAFRKVLEKLSAEGHNLSNPIDLRNHWAKHGTNKFVIIR